MSLGYKGLAIGIIVGAAIVVGAYSLGTKQAQKVAEPIAATSSQSAMPTDQQHSGKTQTLFPTSQQGVKVDPSAKFTHFRVGNRNIKGMIADGNLVWVGTSGGVIRYDLKEDDYKLFDVNSGSLLSNGVFHLSKIKGKIFVGTYGGGLTIHDPENGTWTNYNIPHGLADQFVYDISEEKNGDIWIATWSGANLVRGGRFDDASAWETFTVENTKGGLPNDWVYGVEIGKKGETWFATEGGLAKYSGGKWTNWQHEDGLGAKHELVKDDITFTNDPAKSSKHHARQKEEQGLGDVTIAYNPNYIISLEIDNDGTVWAGTWGGGLAKFDGTKWKNYTVKDGAPANHIFMLHHDQGGNLWLGTSKGLATFDKDSERFNVLTMADGLFSDNVFSMAHAADGSLWVGSFGGVARIFR